MEVSEAFALISRAIDSGRPAHGYLVCGDLHGQCDELERLVLGKLFPDDAALVAGTSFLPSLNFACSSTLYVPPFVGVPQSAQYQVETSVLPGLNCLRLMPAGYVPVTFVTVAVTPSAILYSA